MLNYFTPLPGSGTRSTTVVFEFLRAFLIGINWPVFALRPLRLVCGFFAICMLQIKDRSWKRAK